MSKKKLRCPLKFKLAANFITVLSTDTPKVRSKDILKNLLLDSLDVRRKKPECVFIYMVLNGISAPCSRENPLRLSGLAGGLIYDIRKQIQNFQNLEQIF